MSVIHREIGLKQLKSKFGTLSTNKLIFRAVPVRNKMTLAEKNQNAKVIHDQKRIYINGLLRIVQECTQA